MHIGMKEKEGNPYILTEPVKQILGRPRYSVEALMDTWPKSSGMYHDDAMMFLALVYKVMTGRAFDLTYAELAHAYELFTSEFVSVYDDIVLCPRLLPREKHDMSNYATVRISVRTEVQGQPVKLLGHVNLKLQYDRSAHLVSAPFSASDAKIECVNILRYEEDFNIFLGLREEKEHSAVVGLGYMGDLKHSIEQLFDAKDVEYYDAFLTWVQQLTKKHVNTLAQVRIRPLKDFKYRIDLELREGSDSEHFDYGPCLASFHDTWGALTRSVRREV